MEIKKSWHHLLYIYVISLFATRTRNCQKTEKMMKIVNIDEENLHISQMTWGIFNEIFRKNVSYNIKSHKKAVLYLLSRKYSFGKATVGGDQTDLSAFSGLRLKSKLANSANITTIETLINLLKKLVNLL